MSQEDLDSFVSLLNDKRIPAFASTVSTLTRLTANDDTSNVDLVQAILKDASMTASVLRIANSSFYNLTMRSTSTVTRAIMLVGFETVRSLCLSIKVIESFLRGVQRQQLVREMARCFHGAMQARAIAKSRGDESPEEVFVATLLFRIGQIAFWAFCPSELCNRLERELTKPDSSRSAAEIDVLGFRLRDLTVRLAEEWGLGDLLKNALAGNPANSPRPQYVIMGFELAIALEEGWGTPRLKRLIKDLTQILKRPEEQVLQMLRSNARLAAETVTRYGAAHVGRMMPVPIAEEDEETPSDCPESAADSQTTSSQDSDPGLQLQILREYSALLADGQQNPKLLISMVLEGILRGVAMDRVIFAALTPDGNHLKVTHALGWNPQKSAREFPLISMSSENNVFSDVLKMQKSFWLKKEVQESASNIIPLEISRLLGEPPFFIAPVVAFNRPVGVICCDRNVSGRDLDEESFSGFKHFCDQASLGLSLKQPPGSPPR